MTEKCTRVRLGPTAAKDRACSKERGHEGGCDFSVKRVGQGWADGAE